MKNFFGSGKKPTSSSTPPPPLSSTRKSATFEERDRENHDPAEQPPAYSEPSSPARAKSPSKSSKRLSRPASYAAESTKSSSHCRGNLPTRAILTPILPLVGTNTSPIPIRSTSLPKNESDYPLSPLQ
ncbi:hypothetical protein LB503_008981 [Fusarium chuoi]|nr:hypothetical protein LB503_008981 [Fusarium chuoi]